VERRGLPGAYEVGAAAVYILRSVIVRIRNDAEDGVYEAIKRALKRWRRSSPDTPIYGPDGKTPIDEWLAEREKR
jgi:hypothetical protein